MKYRHYKNGKIYEFVSYVYTQEQDVWSKNKVLYKREGKYFVRDKKEFFEKFIKVEEDNENL